MVVVRHIARSVGRGAPRQLPDAPQAAFPLRTMQADPVVLFPGGSGSSSLSRASKSGHVVFIRGPHRDGEQPRRGFLPAWAQAPHQVGELEGPGGSSPGRRRRRRRHRGVHANHVPIESRRTFGRRRAPSANDDLQAFEVFFSDADPNPLEMHIHDLLAGPSRRFSF